MKKKLRNSKFAYQYPYEIIALEIKLIFLKLSSTSPYYSIATASLASAATAGADTTGSPVKCG